MKFMNKSTQAALALGLGSVLAAASPVALAADHQEAPGTQAQVVADIGDYFAWHSGDSLNVALTFGTFAMAGSMANYNSDILYAMHFDTTEDGVSDLDVYARFAQDVDGNWGVQVMGLGDTPVVGAVETVLTDGDVMVWAGVADDPFFFDLTGFNETINTGTISFNPARDSVAGLNVTSLVLQFPLSTVVAEGGSFQTWATTGSL